MQLKHKELFNQYQELTEGEKLLFLEMVVKVDKYKVEFAGMCEPLRKFHDPEAKRGE